ncbi:MAG: glycosyltransferase, partial [Candidatus Vogelbacteria bacterium]|nr:glycosyltransferase [Candidatus Vogelbacteria bacterium]
GSDRKVFEYGSSVAARQVRYGTMLERLDIIVFSPRKNSLAKKSLSNNVYVYPTNSFSRLLYVFDAIRLAFRLERPDFVSVQDPFESGLAGYIISKYFGVPLHVQIHTDFMSPYFYLDSLLNKIRYFISKFIIPKASCLRVVSKRIEESLMSSGLVMDGSKIRVLPIYVNVNAIKNTKATVDLHRKYSQFKFIILMASRLTKEKDVGLAIDAMGQIVKKIPSVGLLILGDGPKVQALRRSVKDVGLSSNIIFEPWNTDLVSYYKTADVFLLTSKFEGYAMTAVESLAAGTPVIMTDVGCAGDVVVDGQNGLIFPVGDLKAAIDKIEKIITDQKLREHLKSGVMTMAWPGGSEEDYLREYKRGWECAIKTQIK